MEAEEDKMLEHVKEAVHSFTDRNQKWSKKIGSFLWEILIIVIAVNLTIWFHNWNDKRHEQAQVKDFLIDTRENLIQDTIVIRNYINDMTNEKLVYYDSVLSQINRKQIDAQYIDLRSGRLISSYNVEFNYGIYQSFSAANNLRLIENRVLLSDLITLYSTSFPGLQSNVKDQYDRRFDGFNKYLAVKIGFDNTGSTKLSTIIYQPEVIYLFRMGDGLIKSVNESSERVINITASVIQEIDKELKDKFNYTQGS